jgi:hypothetical protein
MANLKVIRDKLEARLKAEAEKAANKRAADIEKDIRNFNKEFPSNEQRRPIRVKVFSNEQRRPIRVKVFLNEQRRPKPKKKSKTLPTERYQR